MVFCVKPPSWHFHRSWNLIVIISEKNESFIACRGIFALSCEHFQVSIMLGKYCNRDPDCIHKLRKCHSQRENLTLFKHQDQWQSHLMATATGSTLHIIKARSELGVHTINIVSWLGDTRWMTGFHNENGWDSPVDIGVRIVTAVLTADIITLLFIIHDWKRKHTFPLPWSRKMDWQD